MANFIYIMGKSSAGKDTVYQRIKDKISSNMYVPYTTRPMRKGEKEGREYHFITREEFKKLQEQGKVMENRDYNVINNKGEKDIWTYTTIADSQWEKEGRLLNHRNIRILYKHFKILRRTSREKIKYASSLY